MASFIMDSGSYRGLLTRISNELREEDVENMKFLCQGLLQLKKIDNVTNGFDLFDLLEQQRLISKDNLRLVEELLKVIERFDLMDEVAQDDGAVQSTADSVLPEYEYVNPFLATLLHQSENIDSSELNSLKYQYGDVPKKYNVTSGIQVFSLMMKHKKLGPTNLTGLMEILQNIGRSDLKDDLKSFENKFVKDDVYLWQKCSKSPAHCGGAGLGKMGRQDSSSSISSIKSSQNSTQGLHESLSSLSLESTLSSSSSHTLIPTLQQTSKSSQAEQNVSSATGFPSHNDNQTSVLRQVEQTVASTIFTPGTASASHHALYIGSTISAQIPSTYENTENLSVNTGSAQVEQQSSLESTNPALLAQEERPTNSSTAHVEIGVNLPLSQMERPLNTSLTENLRHSDIPSAGCMVAPQNLSTLQSSNGASVTELGASSVTNASQSQLASGISSASAGNSTSERGQGRVTSKTTRTNVEELECYRMEAEPRGICKIFNNTQFHRTNPKAKELLPRLGSQKDVERLEKTFKRLLFKVEIVHDKSDTEILDCLRELSSRNHRHYDCLVCCFLTHGGNGYIYGSNGMSIPIRDLTRQFRADNCLSLKGKPKLFFLACCQGKRNQGGQLGQGGEIVQQDCPTPEHRDECTPSEADILLGYSTAPECVSFRSTSSGTWYISELTKVLDKYAHHESLETLLLRVNNAVSKREHIANTGTPESAEQVVYKQVPAPQMTLRKRLWFLKPPY